MATRLLGEAVDHGKLETAALADILGGEERLEDVGPDRRRDPRARVADRGVEGLARSLGYALRPSPGGSSFAHRDDVPVQSESPG